MYNNYCIFKILFLWIYFLENNDAFSEFADDYKRVWSGEWESCGWWRMGARARRERLFVFIVLYIMVCDFGIKLDFFQAGDFRVSECLCLFMVSGYG